MKKLLIGVGLTLTLPAMLLAFLVLVLTGSPDALSATATDSLGMSSVTLAAYEQASAEVGTAVPGCVVPWWLLAGVGKVEWGNGADRAVLPDGEIVPPVIGVALDGTGGNAAIPATSWGITWDGDPSWDHAVGPMQFLPSTWAAEGLRSTDDGKPADPQNVFDAALSAAAKLCRDGGGGDVSDPVREAVAILAYNNSQAYLAEVQGWANYYSHFEMSAGATSAPGLYVLPVDKSLLTLDEIRRPHWDGTPASDLPVPVGTTVFAVEDGTIVPTTDPNCGNGLMLQGDDGYLWTYCHGESLLVTSGKVKAGEPIMLSGSTGESTGPHLHIQVANPAGQLGCPQPLIEAWYEGLAMSPADQWFTSNCGS